MNSELPITEKISGQDIESALASIPRAELKQTNWPVLVSIHKQVYWAYNDRSDTSTSGERTTNFWKGIFNEKNFIYPGSDVYNPETDVLFILHSFKEKGGNDCVFKAITTKPKDFVRDPRNHIDYNKHGAVCERRSRGSYPEINFWEFWDNLSKEDKDKYRIPDTTGRKIFYTKKVSN